MDDPEWRKHAIREDEATIRIKKHGQMLTDARMIADESQWNDLSEL